MAVKGIEHVAVAVSSLDAGIKAWTAMGFTCSHVEVVADQQVKVARMVVGHFCIELLEPTSADSPVAKFIEKRGPGLHHVCLETDQVEADLNALKGAGFALIDAAPRLGAHGCSIAFVHPRATGGVLVELSQPPDVDAPHQGG